MREDWLDAPCRWCGYNGPGYWQRVTHQFDCPWYSVGGEEERARVLEIFDMVKHAEDVAKALEKLSKFDHKIRYRKAV